MTDQLDVSYLASRVSNPLVRYRFKRRATEILNALRRYGQGKDISLLDVGAADGAMLSILKKEATLARACGIEPLQDFVALNRDDTISLTVGSGDALPYADNTFDFVVMASLIEHVNALEPFFKEAHRVLKKDGFLIISGVSIFYDAVGTFLKLKGNTHIHTYSFAFLKTLLQKEGFSVLEAYRYALPSSGFLPFENRIEDVLRAIGMDFFLFYKFMVSRK